MLTKFADKILYNHGEIELQQFPLSRALATTG